MPVAVSKPDFYALLELEKGATEDDIRVAYKKLALKWHPDRHQDHKDEAQEKFVEIQDAYMHLLEDCRRHAKRKARKPKPPPPPSESTKSESAKSSASSIHTTSSSSSKHSDDTRSTHSGHSSRAKRHKEKEHHTESRTKEGSNTHSDPPESPPKNPKKLSKQAPVHADRHRRGNFSRSKSSHDDSTDDENPPQKKQRSAKARSNPEDSDFEFVDLVDLGTPLHPLHSPKLRPQPCSPAHDQDWLFPLPVTLEDLYHGRAQTYRVTRTRRGKGAQCVKLDVRVSPSWRAGRRVRVPGVGNERPDGTFQDIVFVVEEAPHPHFTRVGDDLHVSVQVPWADGASRPYSSASDGTASEEDGEPDEEAYVKGINGKEYVVPIPRSLVEAADGTRIVGAGMPIRKDGKTVGKGDMVIKWEFSFAETEKGQRLRWQNLRKAMPWRR